MREGGPGIDRTESGKIGSVANLPGNGLPIATPPGVLPGIDGRRTAVDQGIFAIVFKVILSQSAAGQEPLDSGPTVAGQAIIADQNVTVFKFVRYIHQQC